jgi:hypothetical protein
MRKGYAAAHGLCGCARVCGGVKGWGGGAPMWLLVRPCQSCPVDPPATCGVSLWRLTVASHCGVSLWRLTAFLLGCWSARQTNFCADGWFLFCCQKLGAGRIQIREKGARLRGWLPVIPLFRLPVTPLLPTSLRVCVQKVRAARVAVRVRGAQRGAHRGKLYAPVELCCGRTPTIST